MKWPQEPRMPGLTHFFSRQTPVGSACARLWQGFCGEPDRCGHVLGECLGVRRCNWGLGRPGKAPGAGSPGRTQCGEGARRLQQVRGLSRRMAWRLCCPFQAALQGWGSSGGGGGG